jgi:hypothetical protein
MRITTPTITARIVGGNVVGSCFGGFFSGMHTSLALFVIAGLLA